MAGPEGADDLVAEHRYNAACSAALAAAGKGADAPQEEKDRASLRGRALEWLRADLAARTRQFDSGKSQDRAAVKAKMRHWQRDSDLAGVREVEALASRAR